MIIVCVDGNISHSLYAIGIDTAIYSTDSIWLTSPFFGRTAVDDDAAIVVSGVSLVGLGAVCIMRGIIVIGCSSSSTAAPLLAKSPASLVSSSMGASVSICIG